MNTLTFLLAVGTVSILVSCGSGGSSTNTDLGTDDSTIAFSSKILLGESLFADKNLSLTRNTSCATCHDSERAFIDARFSQAGIDQDIFINGAFSVGDDGFSLGGRNTPTAMYTQFSPTFSKTVSGYKGGQFHDGRAVTLKDQAKKPPLDQAEMQMPNSTELVARIAENKDYVEAFEVLYGANIFDDIEAAYDAMGDAISTFEKSKVFAPFSSKYDKFNTCRDNGGSTSTCYNDGAWTTKEQLGHSLFFSANNTNCASCHALNSSSEASNRELFTNFKYENIGVPRNISAMDARAALGLQEANATFEGLGATVKLTDANWQTHLGKTKVPTLRNVAVTGPYMNNGVFQNLSTAIAFYDHMAGHGHHTNPETGNVWGENDHNATINHALLQQKVLDDGKIKALEAFLRTLTDAQYESLMPPFSP